MGLPDVDITDALLRCRDGDREAREELFKKVQGRLRQLAGQRLNRFGSGRTLDTGVLVHDAFLKLVDHTRIDFEDRRHFFGSASRAMRQIIVDHVREKAAAKRVRPEHFPPVDAPASGIDFDDVLALHHALERLEQVDERLAEVVNLRFFGGLTVDETAKVLDVDPRTVRRDWVKARGFSAANSAPTDPRIFSSSLSASAGTLRSTG